MLDAAAEVLAMHGLVRFGTAALFAASFAMSCAHPALTPAAGPPPDTYEARAAAPQWSYQGARRGPERWAALSKAYRACGDRGEQSPVDLPDALLIAAPSPIVRYEPFALSLVNDGHTVKAVPPDLGERSSLVLGETPDEHFALDEIHLHAPGEHTLAGRSFDAELHLVHKNRSGALAVVAVLLNRGEPNLALAPYFERLPRDVTENPTPALGATLDPSPLVPRGARFLAYRGSLTTPPCTEDVQWFVVREPQQASDEQIGAFTTLMGGATNRPIQPLGDRKVRLLEGR